jgi:hypothetical protein
MDRVLRQRRAAKREERDMKSAWDRVAISVIIHQPNMSAGSTYDFQASVRLMNDALLLHGCMIVRT